MTAAALVGCHRFKAGAVGSIDGSWRRRPAARQNPSPRILPLSRPVIDRAVVALTSTDPPGETTHWTATAMAKTAGISVLNAVEAKVPAGKTIHVIVHDYAHTQPRLGWRAIPASPSPSPRLPAPGSTPSRASSPSAESI